MEGQHFVAVHYLMQTFATPANSSLIPVVDSLWAAKAIPEYLFSTWLTMNPTGSVLTLGGVNTSSMVPSSLVRIHQSHSHRSISLMNVCRPPVIDSTSTHNVWMAVTKAIFTL